MTTTETLVSTPWGWTQDIEELAEGVWRVSTPSHGGLKLSRERWDSLPAELRDAMFTQTFAEEDCEEPIVRTLLGIGDDREREMALKVAGYFDRYAPAPPAPPRLPPWRPLPRRRPPGRLQDGPVRAVRHPHRGRVLRGRRRDGAGLREAEGRRVQPDAPPLPGGRRQAMTATTRPRPRTLPSTTTKLQTEFGNLYVTVSTDEDGEPFEVFGWLGKGGSFQHGVTELACRLISLHLRRGTPVEEIIDQCRGIQEMQPLLQHDAGRQERGGARTRRRHRPHPQGSPEGQGGTTDDAGGGSAGGCVSRTNNGIEAGLSPSGGGSASHLQEGGDDDGNDDY